MFRTIGLAAIVFIALLIALNMGEEIGYFIAYHMGHLFDGIWSVILFISHQSKEFLLTLWSYIQGNRLKVFLALVLTAPITYWLTRQKAHTQTTGPRRATAILLALLLGWLGAHRFYVGQIGWGIAFLISCYFFPPLALLIGWIDALRYALMDKDEFTHLYAPLRRPNAPPHNHK